MSETKRIEAEIDKLQTAYTKAIETIAEREYNKHVVPFCKRYRAKFYAGMGAWSFYDRDDKRIDDDDPRITSFVEILNLDADERGNTLGEYMPSYK